MTTEREIQNDFHRFNQTRFTTILPNCYPPRWFECDILAITKASYMYEYEIKLSRSDFFNDAKKGEKPEYLKEFYIQYYPHYGKTKYQLLSEGFINGPSKFWYIVPEGLLNDSDIPTFAGWITFRELSNCVRFKEIKRAPRLHKEKVSEDWKDSIRKNLYIRYWIERKRNSVDG